MSNTLIHKGIRFIARLYADLPEVRRIILSRYIKRAPTVGAFPYELFLHEKFWERYFRLSTGGLKKSALEDGTFYEATPYLMIRDIFDKLALTENDEFVDLGCGKGRALFVGARVCKAKLKGVEYDEELAGEAILNINNPDVEICQGKAEDLDYSTATVVYLYNPFGSKTLKAVLDRLKQSLRDNPRRLRIVYSNPLHESVFESLDWLKKTDTWTIPQYPGFHILPGHDRAVSFWEADPGRV